jgi:ABC-2 type transport system permease protein
VRLAISTPEAVVAPATLYLQVARQSFRRHLAYRGATLAGLFTNAVFGVLIASVFTALYRSRDAAEPSVAGFTLSETLTFVWIGQSLLMLVYLWGWWEVAAAIQSGDVVADLMKPIDYYTFWLSRDLGRAACHFLVRFAPTLLFGALLYRLAWPRSLGLWFAFACSLVLAVIVSFAIRFILNVSAFWLIDIRGLSSVAMMVTNLFSGLLVPIPFFPPWLRTVTEFLPFRAVVMVPIEVFLGHGNPVAALGVQLFWAVSLSLLARVVLALAVRKVVVQGG